MNKRRTPRIQVPNLVVDVSDGISFFSGTASDVSRYGILLNDIPKKINEQAASLSITNSVNGIIFKKMKGIPTWVSENKFRKKIGVHIPAPTSSWIAFVKNFETEDSDVLPTVTRK